MNIQWGPYLRNPVCVTLESGEQMFGTLQHADLNQGLIQVDNRSISIGDVTDVEYVGEITDYHTYKKTGEIGRYTFTTQQLAPSFPIQQLLYQEFACTVACHLTLDAGSIGASDVRLLSTLHHVDAEGLCQTKLLYRFADGTCRVGTLVQNGDGFSLTDPEGNVSPIDPRQAVDITLAPETNDVVTALLTDGSTVSGTVSTAGLEDFILIGDDGTFAIPAYRDVTELRFRGKLLERPSPKGTALQYQIQLHNCTFICKTPYFRTPEQCGPGATVTFVPGNNGRYFIAKDIQVEDTSELESHVGVVVYYDKEQQLGYIGNTYVSKGYHNLMDVPQPKANGTVTFTGDQIDFRCSIEQLCVVKYTCLPGNGGLNRATSVTLLEQYPHETCAQIKVFEDDTWEMLPTHIAYLPLFRGQEVELTLSDGTLLTGTLQECANGLACVADEEETPRFFPLAQITAARARGSVATYSSASGTGYIDNYWFHVVNLRENERAVNMARGTTAWYSLVNTLKGKCYMADDITILDVEPELSPPRTGYIFPKNAPRSESGYGFITLPEDLEVLLNGGSRMGIYFRASELAPHGFGPLDSTEYYQVTYLPQGNNAQQVTVVQKLRRPEEPAPKVKPSPPVQNPAIQAVPDPLPGESVLLVMNDQTLRFATYQGVEKNCLLLEELAPIHFDEVDTLFRFGVITEFNENGSFVTLNGMFRFAPEVLETRTFNILKTMLEPRRLHILYACREGKITQVTRLGSQLEQIPWSQTTATQCSAEKRLIGMKGGLTHYSSVLTDGAINRALKKGALLNQPVLVRAVTHPFRSGSGEAKLTRSAVDIHAVTEQCTVKYDPGRDLYRGYRNQTESYPIDDLPQRLSYLVDQEVPVVFAPDADGTGLLAQLGEVEALLSSMGVDSSTLSPEAALSYDDPGEGSVVQSSLVQFMLAQVDLSKFSLRDVSLDENGLPIDLEHARTACKKLQWNRADDLFATGRLLDQFPDLHLKDSNGRPRTRNRVLHAALWTRTRAVAADANALFGEHTYSLIPLLHHGKTTLSALYQLLLQSFADRQALSKFAMGKGDVEPSQLAALLSGNCRRTEEFCAHLMLLDKSNVELVCSLLPKQNPALCQQLSTHIKKLDDRLQESELTELVSALRTRYGRDKQRFRAAFSSAYASGALCTELCKQEDPMQTRFLKLICEDDAARFGQLFRCCRMVAQHLDYPGFAQQESILKRAYQDLANLEREILEHPTLECVEFFMLQPPFTPQHNLLSHICDYIADLLRQMYSESNRPQLKCTYNEPTLYPGQSSVWLIVSNGEANQYLQPAGDIKLHLSSNTDGVSILPCVELRQITLAAGESKAVEIPITVDNWESHSFDLDWSVEYSCAGDFVNGLSQTIQILPDVSQTLSLQISSVDTRQKDIHAINPYEAPAQGQPLTDRNMFFGRDEEFQTVLERIVHTSPQGEKWLTPGSAVILHGQKKCGKTSLVNQIRNQLREDEQLRKQAIILEFSNILDQIGGPGQLEHFKTSFYSQILTLFKLAVWRFHPDVAEMLRENDLPIPNLLANWNAAVPLFNQFFLNFGELDAGRHTVVLVMDEFTQLCATIHQQTLSDPSKEDLKFIPGFIKTFSQQYGFIQIIIGHETMMRVFDTLGSLNHTAEFAKTLELSALQPKDARKLVREPMQKAFGFNVYNTPLGSAAVEKLLDLSGCNPTYLMRLCNEVFEYYLTCPKSQLVVDDINAVASSYVEKLLLKDFDVLLTEDGDEIQMPEDRSTYKYLSCVAQLSARSYDRRTADMNQVSRELQQSAAFSREQVEQTRSLLESRRIISVTDGGRVKIEVGLFIEYVLRRYGGK